MAYQPDAIELAALHSYAAEYGKRWKWELAADWCHARLRACRDMPDRGSILHGLRNHPRFGSTGLGMFRLPK
jgi:hypothetical protein